MKRLGHESACWGDEVPSDRQEGAKTSAGKKLTERIGDALHDLVTLESNDPAIVTGDDQEMRAFRESPVEEAHEIIEGKLAALKVLYNLVSHSRADLNEPRPRSSS